MTSLLTQRLLKISSNKKQIKINKNKFEKIATYVTYFSEYKNKSFSEKQSIINLF